jgi:hypothetical protein
MTSFGATEIVKNSAVNGQQFNSTFKIKGQIYHKVDSLLPMPKEPLKFLQIYFFADVHTQYINHEWLVERAILAAKNVDVNELNLKIQHLLPGDLVSYM